MCSVCADGIHVCIMFLFNKYTINQNKIFQKDCFLFINTDIQQQQHQWKKKIRNVTICYNLDWVI